MAINRDGTKFYKNLCIDRLYRNIGKVNIAILMSCVGEFIFLLELRRTPDLLERQWETVVCVIMLEHNIMVSLSFQRINESCIFASQT